MNQRTSPWSRPLVRIAFVSFAALFIAAPTPGNVGGCGGSAENTVVAAGGPGQPAVFMYFDQGLCSNFCWRLRECGVLCSAFPMSERPSPCANDDPQVFAQCVRGDLNASLFGGAPSCPHACPSGYTYNSARLYDVEACGNAVLNRDCSPCMLDPVTNTCTNPGSIGAAFNNPPTECTNVCTCNPPNVICADGSCRPASACRH